jgi:hypothetical protein
MKFGLWNWLTQKPKTVDDIFDKEKGLLTQAGGWIGNMQFTDEERAEMNQANIKAVQKFVVDTLSENTDRSKARREIAVFFIKFYSVMLFMAGMTFPVNPGWSKVWFELATSLSAGGLVSAITVFFFGSYALARHQETKPKA